MGQVGNLTGMGDHSFARLIKKRRDALGLSQARLGDLVGRSASTIRNWERAQSSPSERSDVVALAAVLGLDESEALERAGFEAPAKEDNPTVEQAYASLTAERIIPLPAQRAEVDVVRSDSAETGDGSGPKPEESLPQAKDKPLPPAPPASTAPDVPASPEHRPWTAAPPRPASIPGMDPKVAAIEDPGPVVDQVRLAGAEDEPPRHGEKRVPGEGSEPRRARRAAPPTVLEAAAPGEPSYVEDPEARQQYRIRALVTAALVIGIVVVLLWSFNRATDALGGLWQELVDSLAL